MELDSVREVKRHAIDRLARSLRPDAKEVSAYGLAAGRTIEVVRQVHRTVALGIHPLSQDKYQLAVRVQRRGLETSPIVEQLLKDARNEADVRYIGRVLKQNAKPTGEEEASFFRRRHRPLLIGSSIGHIAVTAGTLGCFVTTDEDNAPKILSNNHVLADEGQGDRGDEIIQPGSIDKGRSGQDSVGRLADFKEFERSEPNQVDCALATINEGVTFDPSSLSGVGSLKGTAYNLVDIDRVGKLGRTTGRTRGRVTAFEVDNIAVVFETGTFQFAGQIEIESEGSGPFSNGGDSGSLIFSEDSHLAVGLLFAGSDQGGSNGQGLTYANPIETVLSELGAGLLL
jgi:hypothetical protein